MQDPEPVGTEELHIRCCTWNLGGMPVGESLRPLVAPDGERADVVAVGAQELCELNTYRLMLAAEHGDLEQQGTFAARIKEALEADGDEFDEVSSVGLVGLFTVVFVRRSLQHLVSEVACDRVKTGALGGYLGNKGAVGVRFQLGRWRLCFVNVHLRAGVGESEARDRDIVGILQACFQAPHGSGAQPAPDGEVHLGRDSCYAVGMHHATMMFGDFNFRLQEHDDLEWPDGDVCDWLERDTVFSEWLQHDEREHKTFKGLSGYDEGRIDFPPTYRYLRGRDELDRKRVPAWTDRILYRSTADAALALREYRSVPELNQTSDHRPVTAVLRLTPLQLETRRQMSLRSMSMNLRSMSMKAGNLLRVADLCKFSTECCAVRSARGQRAASARQLAPTGRRLTV